MYTLNKIERKSPPINRLFVVLLSFFISLTLLISAVKFVLNFTPLYKFDVNFLKIDQLTNMSREDILSNYNALITYLKPSYKGDLNFTTLPMSMQGRIHFVEVKNIFVNLHYIMLFSLTVSILGIAYCIKRRDNLFLKLNSLFLIILPVTLAAPFAIDFDKSFTAFHKIFFRNDYWLFDPKTDPVINMLPQEFFFHSAVLILVIISLESILSYYLYRKTKKRKSSQFKYL
jgi:integral membrane protein (TIGR01906 family)